MSQDKVNRYKEEKRNRKKNIAKEKRVKLLKKIGYSLIGVLLAGWVVFCCVRVYQDANKPTVTLSNEELQSLINELLSQQSTTTGQNTTTKEGETTTAGEKTTTKEGETTVAGETTTAGETTKEGETTANSETTTNSEEETTKQ